MPFPCFLKPSYWVYWYWLLAELSIVYWLLAIGQERSGADSDAQLA
jgi:hypothetical protein